MTIPDEDIRDYDELAAALGTTPKYNSAGQIVPIGRPEGKSAGIHAVYIGRGIGFYNNWGLCFAMTAGYPGSCHKKYRNLEEARLAWDQGPVELRGKWRAPTAPRPPKRTPGFEVDEEDMHPVAAPSTPLSPSCKADVAQPSPLPLTVPTLRDEADSADEEERMWREAGWPDDASRPEDSPPLSVSLSPTISSVSSLSISPTPALTAGTISPAPISTPALPVTAFPPQSNKHITTRTLSCPVVDRARSVHPIRRRQDSSATATPPASPTKRSAAPIKPEVIHPPSTSHFMSRSPVKKSQREAEAVERVLNAEARSSTPRYDVEQVRVPVHTPKEIFVVVRGDYPGIYFDRNTALAKLGTNAGMKLAVFSSLSRASWYFVQCYMARKVGVPIVVVSDSEVE